ncbi:MAG: sigma-70 family RNA polymerase sigma factor [Actinomycetota bacterium]
MTIGGGDGDVDRLTEVYEAHASAVAAYVLRRAPAADAPDAVAETFMVAWRRRDVLPPEPDTLPWLYGVARRVVANQRRSDRRRSELSDRLRAGFVGHGIDPPSLDEIEDLHRVARAMKALSDDDAEILRLASWEELRPAEIATALGIGTGAVRQRLHRARRRLRDKLDEDESTPFHFTTRREERRCSTNSTN